MTTQQYTEEISTIFVVGFPEDMQEREFQNMFLFCPGFEAATLKVPQNLEGEENSARKQTIGFAKFRTRQEAIAARDILSGRKVDQEKGSMLKAEMAKKNLHTKRSLSNDQKHTASLNSPLTANFNLNLASKRLVPPPGSVLPTPYDPLFSMPLVSPLLNDLLSPSDYTQDLFSDVLTPGNPTANQNERSGSVELRDTSLSTLVTQRAQRAAAAGLGGNTLAPGLGTSIGGARGNFYEAEDVLGLDYLSRSTPAPSSCSSSSNVGGGNGLPASSVSASVWSKALDDLPPVPQSARFPSLSSFGGLASPSLPSSPIGGGLSLPPPSANPADNNPPCNTLYVGNLPHGAQEEELRQLFMRCAGYKRLSFRSKPTGPMCFVEFESIEYAIRALSDLQGTPLSNSAGRGGIRLSFSKNPLGVRTQPPTPLSPHSPHGLYSSLNGKQLGSGLGNGPSCLQDNKASSVGVGMMDKGETFVFGSLLG
ncbi:uncharacterized protein VTP21DRAFT_11212 [Calcarisporiella thermophila]|uniref:uncharacterized protein n=1 Tax=Calcarisporiella thermophila TaxID=911321 RepID=UPI00374425B7